MSILRRFVSIEVNKQYTFIGMTGPVETRDKTKDEGENQFISKKEINCHLIRLKAKSVFATSIEIAKLDHKPKLATGLKANDSSRGA